MKIEHIAIWTNNLETLRSFYETYFCATTSKKYINSKTGFESYFLVFSGTGTRLELMSKPGIKENEHTDNFAGIAHFAFSVGSKEKVDYLTGLLKSNGIEVVSGPRETGDGYYESCVLDPDGNCVEITV